MNKRKKKAKMEYRYYQMPPGSYIMALLGRNGSSIMEEILITCIFIIIWRLDIVMRDRGPWFLGRKSSGFPGKSLP